MEVQLENRNILNTLLSAVLLLVVFTTQSFASVGGADKKLPKYDYFNKIMSDGSYAEAFGIGTGSGGIDIIDPITGNPREVWAGTIDGEVDGDDVLFYCIDIGHMLATSKEDNKQYYEEDGNTSAEITYILNNYYPFVNYPYSNALNSAEKEAAAIQLAIWHFSDGLDANTIQQIDLKNRTLEIIADADANASSVTYPNTLDIVPLSQTIPSGQAAQFEVYTKDNNGDPAPNVVVTLTSTSGTLSDLTVTTDATGKAAFSLVQGSEDFVEVTASATVTIPQGTRFVHVVEPDEHQKIVLATPVEGNLSRTAVVNWEFAEDDCDGDGDNSVSTFDGFKFEFDNVVNNGNSTQTWTYTVTGVGADHDLSHWVLALCEDHNVIDASYDRKWEVVTDPKTNVYGIKWDKEIDKNGGTKTFSFTLDGVYDTDVVDVAFFAGNESFYCTILGPSCDEVEDCENAIGDYIWHDKDVDGIQDNDEAGIEGVVVELFDGANTFTTTTDENGYYEFTGLPNGAYTVKVASSNYASGGVLESTTQTKWYSTKKNEGGDDTKDSDADKDEAVTVNLNCNNDYTIDFGFYKTCVSLIKEGPATAQPGEEITYTFRVENCGDVKLTGGVNVYDEMIEPNGDHKIKYLSPVMPGEVQYFEKKYTIPAEFCGDLVNHAYAVGHPYDNSPEVRDDSEWTTVVECALDCEGEIGDRIWLDYTPDKPDYNCNGIQDDKENIGEDGEPGLENVRVLLKNANGDILDEEFTNEHGNYLFTKLCAGTYYVFVDESTIPSDYTPAPSDQGNDDVDSDQNGVKVVLGSDDAVDYSVDFGYCAPEEEPEVDIEINKSTMGTNLEDGDQFTYIISVINNGPDDATGVKVSDQLPDGVVYIGHTASAGTFDNNTGEWMVGNLPNGQTETLEITVQVDVDEVNNATFNLGPAADYNLFVLYDVTQPSSDTEGRVAVGRDANFANYSIGDKLPPNSGDVLVVGRNLEYTSGAVYNGNVVYGNNTNLDSNYYAVSISGGTLRKDYPIDFPAARSYLKGLSNTLFGYATNGSTTMEWGGLKLEGTNPLLNVFKVDGSDLSNANNVSISVPNGSVVLVNISGDNISWSGGLTVTGTSIGNVLYNFKQAKNITIQGIDVRGSILAPKAHVNFTAGVQNGQMICKSLEGAGQFNNTQFIGNIPVETEIVNIATVIGVIEFDTNENNDSDEATVVINAQDDGEGDGEGGGDGDGNDWEFVGGFLEGQIVWSLTYTDDGCILVGTIGGAIYKSNPDGTEFIQINEGMNVGFIWALLAHNGYYYAGTEQGVFRYDGSSWTLVGLDGMDVRSLVAVDGKIYAGVWLGGVYVSTNDGDNWTAINTETISWAAVHDITANVTVDFNVELFVATLGNGVCFSPDGGESWTKLNLEYNFVWSIASTSTGTLFAGTYGDGLYTSDDNGQNWTKVVGVNAQYIYDITVDAEDNVYISTLLGGIYTSNNGGSSFSNAGMGGFGTSSVLAFGTSESSSVYVGTSDGSIYRKITGDGVTSVGNEEDIPKEFRLDQNYPNPFNPSTTIQFAVPKAGEYKVVVYNILGQQVAELLNTQLQPGVHKVEFGGNNLASGIYIYQLIGNEVNFTKKMILMK